MIVVHSAEVSTLYPLPTHSDFIAARATRKPPFVILTLPLVYGPEITTCHYKGLLWVICQAYLR
jgi:hypothetical protein